MTLFKALPELVHDVAGSLIREGRGKVADQLRQLPLVSWAFDEVAQMTVLRFTETTDPETIGETISFYDNLGVSVHLDRTGHVVELEVTGYEESLARLR